MNVCEPPPTCVTTARYLPQGENLKLLTAEPSFVIIHLYNGFLVVVFEEAAAAEADEAEAVAAEAALAAAADVPLLLLLLPSDVEFDFTLGECTSYSSHDFSGCGKE